MQNFPSPNDLVLIAIMPSPRDLELVRLLGWYRIPLRTSPKVVAVDYLAFYQPASFGDAHKWRVEYFAPVLGHELVTRAELFTDQSDHPNAKEEYFKIQLGAVEQLSTPILAKKWKRLTFLYTTGERLLSSATIDSLGVHDEERQILWRALRERAQSDQIYGVQDLPELAIALEILAMLKLGFEGSKPGDDIGD
jgi:hypothetical protein